MTNPRSSNTNVYQGKINFKSTKYNYDCSSTNQVLKFCWILGGGHFEFSSEKKWGIEQEDFRIFDSIDMTHLAASIASVPFNIQHDIPVELFTVCNS